MYSYEMLPSVQIAPSSSTTSPINIDMKLKSKDTIQGHQNYSSRYRRLSWQCNSSQNWHGVTITCDFPKIRHPLWPRKVETIICKIIHHSLPLWPYLSTIYQDLLKYQKFFSMTSSEKKSTSGRGYREPPQLFTWAVWLIIIRKRTVYTITPLWNSPFTSIHVNSFIFRCQSVFLISIDYPSTRITSWRRLSPFQKIQP